MRRFVLAALVLPALVLAVAAMLPSPASTQQGAATLAGDGPKVVASTAWAAAFARAAGATRITVVAPASVPHPPDYDPKPSDLAAVADANFVVMAPFDGFARRLREAAGSAATVITLDLVNAPETVRSEVTRLGQAFGTTAAATAWLRGFDEAYAQLVADTTARRGDARPKAVVQRFMRPWAELAGLEVVGLYGPGPLQPAQLAELVAKAPDVVVKNAHSEREGAPSAGRTIAEATGARQVALINFPGADQDLLAVFRENARRLGDALAK
ncbi:hypothetical protein CCR97_17910 [Rhodoplanes elegans]|uniref:ABC transporter substrate-binding protein n=1 Tax=Rhodoplanes elegans TaxID=29408 RepID=A0A327KNV7_9BRAD|nr:zinc ABC transporter substrate-binding protein [Rhodoplanes elegans]MBK5960066.1 hypothetical protein [Rhodoplanes elegans]RAI39012.1 hypothetical protein CH338_10790 [Rhodoplanes elegans]